MVCDDCETFIEQGANGLWYSTGELDLNKAKAEAMKNKAPTDNFDYGKNRAEPFRWVKHGELTRSGESPYRSKCPVCKEGLLLIARLDNGDLNKLDSCIRCAQRFVYEDDAINGEKVVCPMPTTLEAAVEALEKMLHAEDRRFLLTESDVYAAIHHSLGRHLRNTWCLWHDSPLARHLKTVHKVEHPDDMSHKIVEAFIKAKMPDRWERIREQNDL